jgi:translation initiation factor IF-2
MRVYEFSKQSGISAKQILELLRDEGIDLGNHMSILSPEALAILEKYSQKSKVSKPSKAKQPVIIKEMEKPQQKIVTEPPTKKLAGPLLEKPIKKETQEAPKQKIATEPSVQQPLAGIQRPLILQSMTVGDAATRLGQPVTDVIVTLLRWGILAAKNQAITEAVVAKLAEAFGVETVKAVPIERKESHLEKLSDKSHDRRLPVVAVLGHVDHGKTTLLDFIRKTRLAAREKGGITQHLGAYEATTSHGNVIFIDTPGHAAFSRLRERGIRVADIVILVVAADDSVMPQTVEAIKQAKSMGVPVIVALNKVDLVSEARLEAVKRDLMKYDLLWEEWGGDTVIVPISAKTGTGIDQLLELIVLQSELMDLRADTATPGHCYVLETQFERGRGPVATILCQRGTVRIGDYFSCGSTVGKVNTITNSLGKRLTEFGPSVPVRIAGFDELAQAGDIFSVIPKQEYRKIRASGEQRSLITPTMHREGSLRIILKADTDSSRGALVDAIQNLSRKHKDAIAIIQASVGDVSESDIMLAETTKSTIVTFNVKLESNAASLAKKLDIPVKEFDIIYKLLENFEETIEQGKERELKLVKTGEAEVRVVFDIKGTGKIAGSYVKQGTFFKGANILIFRGPKKVGEGKIKSLQRDRKTVNEVTAGYECAFIVDGFNDWIEGDRVECYKQS